MRKYVKAACLTTCMICALALLSGCSLFGPKSAEDVIEKYNKAQEKIENFHTEGTIDIKESFTADNAEVNQYLTEAAGVDKLEIPATMNIEMDAGRETAHGDMDISMSFAGKSEKTSAEMYIDQKNGITYTKQQSGDWTKSSSDSTLMALTDLGAVKADGWQNFSFEKAESGYILSASMKELKDDDMFDYFSGHVGDAIIDDLEIEDDGKVIYVFDKDCRLVAVEMKDVVISGATDLGSGLGNLNCTMDMNVKFILSKFNELQEDDYTIPSDVIKNAVESTSGLSVDSGSGGTAPAEPSTPAAPAEPSTPAEPTPAPAPTPEPAPAAPSAGSTVLDGSTVQGQNGKYCFTVGQDIPAGTYKVYKVSGSGIVSVTDAVTFEQNYSLSIGYGLPEDMVDGTAITLESGDEVYVTSSLIVELK